MFQSNHLSWCLCLLVGWGLGVGACATEKKTKEMKVHYGDGTSPVKIVRRYGGSDAGFKDPGVRLINSKQQLQQLGSVDLKTRGISFDKESIVLLTLGEKPTTGFRGWITGVQYADGKLFVQGVANRPTKDQIIMNMLTYPYDAVVIPKVSKATVHAEIRSQSGRRTPLER